FSYKSLAGKSRSGENAPDNFAVYVGEAEVPTLETECQPLVVDAQAVQQRRLQVVDVHRVADDVVAVVVRRAVHNARPNTAAGQPHREAAAVVVAAVVCL